MAAEEQLRVDYITSQNLEKEVSGLESNISVLERDIKNHFSNLGYKTVDKKNFEYQLGLISDKLKRSERQLNQKQIDLASLNVLPADYLFDEKRDHSFAQSQLDELNNSLYDSSAITCF
jgi:DNA repair exonuclease SbcCD ATPase subunit